MGISNRKTTQTAQDNAGCSWPSIAREPVSLATLLAELQAEIDIHIMNIQSEHRAGSL